MEKCLKLSIWFFQLVKCLCRRFGGWCRRAVCQTNRQTTPLKIDLEPKRWRFGRCFFFGKRWFSGCMFIFQCVPPTEIEYKISPKKGPSQAGNLIFQPSFFQKLCCFLFGRVIDMVNLTVLYNQKFLDPTGVLPNLFRCFESRWAPTSYKWNYDPYKWPYKNG